MMHVELSPLARHDLHEIDSYITQRNPVAARRIIERLLARCQMLQSFPNQGRACPDISKGLRCVALGNYTIYYRIIDDIAVRIVRVLHAKRLPDGLV